MPLYLDSNVFIAALESDSEKGVAARWLLRRAEVGEIAAVTSELTVAEVLPRPLADGNEELALSHKRALTSGDGLKVCPITWETLLNAASLRAVLNVSLPDAIHTATALSHGCSAIVTEDRRLKVPDHVSVLRLDYEALQ